MKQVIEFLLELKQNNNRDWFDDNKDRYQEVKSEHEAFTGKMIQRIAAFDPEIAFLTPRDCTFRIYRDVRFSKNKEPYKTNMGAAMSKGGKKSRFASYYLHIEPGDSFIGGGKWMPPADVLKLIRLEIYHFPDEFKKIISHPDFVAHLGGITGDKLKNPPKDFPSGFEDIELLKFKSYIVGKNLTDEEVVSDDLMEKAVSTFRIMMPFIHFLNRAVEDV
jgi:uncharacterized protein (TIGR02453 family)